MAMYENFALYGNLKIDQKYFRLPLQGSIVDWAWWLVNDTDSTIVSTYMKVWIYGMPSVSKLSEWVTVIK